MFAFKIGHTSSCPFYAPFSITKTSKTGLSFALLGNLKPFKVKRNKVITGFSSSVGNVRARAKPDMEIGVHHLTSQAEFFEKIMPPPKKKNVAL